MINILQDRFGDWIEEDISRYAGDYNYFEFKGSDCTRAVQIKLTYDKGRLFAVRTIDQQKTQTGFCTVEGNKFRMEGSGWQEKGKFVLKSPPSNAKGPIFTGLMIGNSFYSGSEH